MKINNLQNERRNSPFFQGPASCTLRRGIDSTLKNCNREGFRRSALASIPPCLDHTIHRKLMRTRIRATSLQSAALECTTCFLCTEMEWTVYLGCSSRSIG